MSEKAEQVEEELKLNKERGLYDASKLLSMKLILKTLEQYRQQLVKDNRLDPDEAFAFIKASFAKDTEERKQLIQTAAAYLENAFAFMERMPISIVHVLSETMVLQNMIATINRCSLMRNVRISSVISGKPANLPLFLISAVDI